MAQDSLKIKELRKQLSLSKSNYTKALKHCEIAEEYENFSSDSCFFHAKAAFAIADQSVVNNDTTSQWKSIYYKAQFFAACYYGVRRIKKEMFALYFPCFVAAQKANDLKFIAKAGTNLGIELLVEGKQSMLGQKCISLANEAATKANDPKLIIRTQSGLAYFYQNIGEYKKSLHYFKLNAKYLKEVDVDFSVLTYISIGRSFIALNQPDSAIFYLTKTLKNYQSLNLEFYTASLRIYLGRAYLDINEIEKAMAALHQSIFLFNKYNNIIWPESYLYLAEAYEKKNDLDSSKHFYRMAIDQSIAVQNNRSLSEAYLGMSNILHQKGLNKEAIQQLQLHLSLLEELGSNKQRSQILRYDLLFDHKKKMISDSLQHLQKSKIDQLNLAKLKSINEKNENEKTTLFISFTLLILIISYGIRSYIKIHKQNRIIKAQRAKTEQQLLIANTQKDLLEEQNRAIENSLRYAERIQNNFLPSRHFLGSFQDHSFVLFKPKNIISSDFYCFVNKGKYKIIALINSNEQGVPGALSSIMIYNQLNNLIREEFNGNLTLVLAKLHEYLKKNILQDKQSENNAINIGIYCLDSDYELSFIGCNVNLIIQQANVAKVFRGSNNSFSESTLLLNTEKSNLQSSDMVLMFSPDSLKQLNSNGISEKNLLQIVETAHQSKSSILTVKDTLSSYLYTQQTENICAIGIQI